MIFDCHPPDKPMNLLNKLRFAEQNLLVRYPKRHVTGYERVFRIRITTREKKIFESVIGLELDFRIHLPHHRVLRTDRA